MNRKFDCWFVEGELNWKDGGFAYLMNKKYKRIKTRHNVSLKEAQAWLKSAECFKMNALARKKGLDTSYFCTIALDQD